jgi:hypothetical protein
LFLPLSSPVGCIRHVAHRQILTTVRWKLYREFEFISLRHPVWVAGANAPEELFRPSPTTNSVGLSSKGFGKIEWVVSMMLNETFRALCVKVADEQDPKKLELLKQQMRLLLLQESPDPPEVPDLSTFSNAND